MRCCNTQPTTIPRRPSLSFLSQDPSAFLRFVADASTTYRCTILRLERFYGAQGITLPPDPQVPERDTAQALQQWPEGVPVPGGGPQHRADVRPWLCRCLVALGDLARCLWCCPVAVDVLSVYFIVCVFVVVVVWWVGVLTASVHCTGTASDALHRYAAPFTQGSGARDTLHTAVAYYRAAAALHPHGRAACSMHTSAPPHTHTWRWGHACMALPCYVWCVSVNCRARGHQPQMERRSTSWQCCAMCALTSTPPTCTAGEGPLWVIACHEAVC